MWAEQALLRAPVVVLAMLATVLAMALEVHSPEQIEARLDELKQEIGAIQQRLDRHLGERDRHLEELASAERRVSSARRSVRSTALELDQTQQAIEELEQHRGALEAESGEHAQALARQLAVAYRHGNDSRLKMLLNQDDPRRLSRQLAYHGYLTRARLSAMDQLNETLEALAQTSRDLDKRLRQQRQLLVQQEAELAELEQAQGEREEALAQLEGRIRDDRERIDDLEQDAAELTRLLEELATALADVPPEFEVAPFAELRGKLPVPVEGPVVRSFGDRRGGDMQWSGWLIRADVGEPVRAIAHGRVAYADWLRGYGLILIIDHGDGFMSLYAHNESLLRDVGDWVNPGETVAIVGNSGGASEPGIYFELRREGRPLDPVGWVDR
jgi:murein hydrolase activator